MFNLLELFVKMSIKNILEGENNEIISLKRFQ